MEKDWEKEMKKTRKRRDGSKARLKKEKRQRGKIGRKGVERGEKEKNREVRQRG